MKKVIMGDSWTDRLSEYLDDELSALERAALEQHLAGCDDCRAVLTDLRAVTAIAAGAAPVLPAHDLWPEIATRIGAPAPAGVVALAGRRPRPRFSFTLPQLAAAAVVLMGISASAVWVAIGGRAPDGPVASAPAARPGASPAVLAGNEQRSYEAAIAELEGALASSRGQLDTATVRVLERSLATIDRAIDEARVAVDRDPGNPYLHRHLDGAMKKKMDILRRAVTVRRAGT
jgi:hypothetical protein